MSAPNLPAPDQTPTTNRGVTVTPPPPPAVAWAGVHWLTGTTQKPLEAVRDILCEEFGGLIFEDRETGIWTYHRRAVERNTGAFFAWTPERRELAVNIPGEACELLGLEGLVRLSDRLQLRTTRLDLAWDTDLFTPAQVRAAHAAGDAVTHAKWDDWRQNPDGSTFYVGKRAGVSNARLVRFYDRRGPTRVELEVHKLRAHALWLQLRHGCASLEEWSGVGMAYLVDFLDFRDRSEDTNVGRAPRLPWWDFFTAGASRLFLPIPRKAPTLESQQDWLEGQVAPTLALVADSMLDPERWIRRLVAEGQARRSPAQSALLDVTRQVRERAQAVG
jgi:Replication initiation factor